MTEATPEAALDRLLETDVVREHEDDTLTTNPAFEDTRRVYADTYGDCSEETFRSTIADIFGFSEDEAAAHIEETGVTRGELTAFLALRSFLDEEPATETLAVMSRVVMEVEPASVVPRTLRKIGEGEYEAFLEAHPDTIFTVWKQACEPCDAMKEDLDAILEIIPDDVAVAGVDGEAVPDFRREFDVTAAPSVVVVKDGEHELTESGRQSPMAISKLVEDYF
ncbi:MAG: thioredoxin domain-containing protein [Halopenitus sp.]